MKEQCEKCEKPAVHILARRIHEKGFQGSTSTDPDAPLHPRCGDHLAPGDAWLIDGLEPKVARFWTKP